MLQRNQSHAKRRHFIKSAGFILALLVHQTVGIVCQAADSGKVGDTDLYVKAGEAWDAAWNRFFHGETRMFYDFVGSYDPSTRFYFLPSPEETLQRFPNSNGWGTGMEDCAISGGVMMSVICDRYEVLGEPAMRKYADDLFKGLVSLGTLSPSSGFVIRGVTPADGKSHYPESSIDQHTWYMYGLWRYFSSPLSGREARKTIRKIVTSVCRRMEQNVIPENDYHFGREDGTFDGLVDKMWKIKAHGMGRLPMIYLIGASVTGDNHWKKAAGKYIPEAAAVVGEASTSNVYAMLQHQISLETLYQLDKHRKSRIKWREAMERNAERSLPLLARYNTYEVMDVGEFDSDWRKSLYVKPPGYRVPQRTKAYINEISSVREPAEGALMQLICPGWKLRDEQLEQVKQNIAQVDYSKCSTSAVYYTLAVYWRSAREGVFCLPREVSRK